MRSDEILFFLHSSLNARKRANLFRSRRIVEPVDSIHVLIEGRTYTNFASNNYLGLTHHPKVISASIDATNRYGAGAGAASLITGYTPEHAAAEAALAAWKKTERAVLLPSGYQANHAVIQAVAAVADAAGRGVRFLLDKLSHASLIDAVRATAQPFRIFPHNHLDKLQRLLTDAPEDEIQVVITESIFSMDGDAADLRGLAELKQQHPFLLILDEAHATGVYGPQGSGLAAEWGISHLPDLTIVTLSKALGVVGGVVCASSDWCDAVLNFGRASIYTTNLPPSIPAAARAAVDVLHDEPHRQKRLREMTARFRQELGRMGFSLPSGDSPIVPLLLGEETAALAAADHLLSDGLLALPIRPPTVPPGTSRLRLTLSSDHTDAEISHLLQSLARL